MAGPFAPLAGLWSFVTASRETSAGARPVGNKRPDSTDPYGFTRTERADPPVSTGIQLYTPGACVGSGREPRADNALIGQRPALFVTEREDKKKTNGPAPANLHGSS